jgi:uncharacterized membrane protein
MKLLALAVLPFLGACAPFPPPSSAPYHGAGTEPFWSLTIDERNLAFELAGEQPIVQRRPKAIVGIAGEIYQTPRIDVNIVHGQCSDGMSDRVYPDKLQVTVDGERFNGCGGL